MTDTKRLLNRVLLDSQTLHKQLSIIAYGPIEGNQLKRINTAIRLQQKAVSDAEALHVNLCRLAEQLFHSAPTSRVAHTRRNISVPSRTAGLTRRKLGD